MNTRKIKTTILTLATTAIATFGLAACDKNTEPGETNIERSDNLEEGSLIDQEESRYDTTDLEGYYEDADHENHSDNEEEKVIGDGAYDGKGDGIERDDVQ
ncbi:hypothetical protein ACFS7Z_12490 [Pontibacter toksunensis]|uniref:Uncharacterized protein n=1 Tax=Pontibacter toksunensis TaxID=1332631 RepID=A0ABW6BYR1_9BACT